MNRCNTQRAVRRLLVPLALVLVAACGGGDGGSGGGGGSTPPAPEPEPLPDPVTFEVALTGVAIVDVATGDSVGVDGLPLGGAQITVSP